tara:strand:+ start:3742 stop:6162 length:2421 start_codon:yes stop_codon:yes gene_type:complete
MAEQVGVRIGSKFDKTGVDQASAGVKGFSTEAEKSSGKVGKSFLEMTAKFYLAVKAIQKIKKVFSELTDAYGVQDDAERKLAAAARNNPYLNGAAVTGLTAYASELQNVSRFGDEVIIDQQSFLAALGQTEETIRNVTLAAVEFASTGQVNLETAFRQMNQTLSGSTGRLGLMIPALKELTEEELKAGEGLQVIIDQFKGMKEASVEGFAGMKIQMKNTFGDIKEDVGEIFLSIFDVEAIKEKLDGVAEWFEENKGKIYAVFTNIPALAEIAFTAVKEMIELVFAPDAEVLGAFAGAITSAITIAFNTIPDIWEGVLDVLSHMWSAFGKTAINEFLLDTQFMWQNLGAQMLRLLQGKALLQRPETPTGPRQIDTGPGSLLGAHTPIGSTPEERLKTLYSSMMINASEIFNVIKTGVSKMVNESGIKEAVGVLSDTLSGPGEEAVRKFAVVLSEGAEEYEDATADVVDATADVVESLYTIPENALSILPNFKPPKKKGKGSSDTDKIDEDDPDYIGAITGGTGELGALLAGGDPLMILINAALGAALQVEELSQVVNFLTTAFAAMFEILGPSLSAVLMPVVELIKMLGIATAQLLEPVLTALVPIFNVISLILSTALVPIFQTLALVLSPVVAVIQILSPILTAFAVLLETVMIPIRFIGDLFQYLSEVVKAFGQKLAHIIAGDFRKAREVEGPGEFSSDAVSGYAERVQAIIEAGTIPGTSGIIGDEFGMGVVGTGTTGTTGGGIYGGNTNISAPPIYNVYISAEQVNGIGGVEEFGRLCAEALFEYVGIGGQLNFLENTAEAGA